MIAKLISAANSWPLRSCLSFLAPSVLLLLLACPILAQESVSAESPESDNDLLMKAEVDLKLLAAKPIRNELNIAYRAKKTLKSILQRNPDTPLRFQILEDLKPVHEILGKHSLAVATFYMDHPLKGRGEKLGAEVRLREILREYPGFSQMDEVLFRLSELADIDESPDDTGRYLMKLICDYPSSKLSASAFSRLVELGMGGESCENLKPSGSPALKP